MLPWLIGAAVVVAGKALYDAIEKDGRETEEREQERRDNREARRDAERRQAQQETFTRLRGEYEKAKQLAVVSHTEFVSTQDLWNEFMATWDVLSTQQKADLQNQADELQSRLDNCRQSLQDGVNRANQVLQRIRDDGGSEGRSFFNSETQQMKSLAVF